VPLPVVPSPGAVARPAVVALDTGQGKDLGIGIVIALLVVGVVISLIIGHIVARVIVLVVAIALALVVWSQRQHIESAAKNCDASFLGIQLTPSDPTLKKQCQQLTKH
jgi:hypothetical protein